MSPQQLYETGFLQAVNASLFYPETDTYTSAGVSPKISFYVIHRALSPMVVSVKAVPSSHVTKHSAVILRLSGRARHNEVFKVRKPPRLCCSKHIGCPQAPPIWDFFEEATRNAQTQADVDECYGAFRAAMVPEMLDVCQSDHDPHKWLQPPKIFKTKAVPPVSAYPLSNPEGTTWRYLSERVSQYFYFAHAAREGWAKRLRIYLCSFVPSHPKPAEWPWWRKQVKRLAYFDPDSASEFVQKLVGLAEEHESKAMAARSKAWNEWCKEAAKTPGAARIHKFAKGPVPWAESLCIPSFRNDAGTPQHNADLRVQPYHDLWEVQIEDSHLCWPRVDDFNNLKIPTVDQCRSFSPRYKVSTAIGIDGIHPRILGLLSDGTIMAFINLACMSIRLGLVPSHVCLLLVSLIPKRDGGDRPIGVFPTFVRWISKIFRFLYGESWLLDNKRCFRFGGPAGSSLASVWRQSAINEYAVNRGLSAATALYDIVKAFENINHQHLINQAVKYGFNLCVLRWCIRCYRMRRVIVVQGVATNQVCTSKTVVPGDSFADILMFLSILSALDNTVKEFEQLHIAVVADDIQFSVVDTPLRCAVLLLEAHYFLRHEIEVEALLPISQDKLAIVTSDHKVAEIISKKDKCFKKSFKSTTRNLGVDFAGGKRYTKSNVRMKRVAITKFRSKRLRRVLAAGVRTAQVVRAGLHSAALYGAGVNGIDPIYVSQLKTIFHKAVTMKYQARSATADLHFESDSSSPLDPEYEAHACPIVWWCASLWNQLLPRQILLRSFSTAIANGKKPEAIKWKFCNGPASATVYSINKIGWECISPVKWQMQDGHIINIDEVCPRTVKALVCSAVREVIWKRAGVKNTSYAALHGRPFTEPIQSLLRSKPKAAWNGQHQGMLRSIVACGIWPEERLRIAGYLCDGLCDRCGIPATVEHYIFACEKTRDFRFTWGISDDLLDARSNFPNSPLWSVCMCPDPTLGYPKPTFELKVEWENVGDDGPCFPWPGFGDGSGRFAFTPSMRRCGWAVLSARLGLDDVIERGPCAHGPLPGIMQAVPAAELFAFYMYLVHAMPAGNGSYTYTTDCQWVIDTWHIGKEAACNGWAHHAGLWRKVFQRAEDLGTNLIFIRKVKAHLKVQDAETPAKRMILQANSWADAKARQGVLMHPGSEDHRNKIKNIRNLVIQNAKYAASVLLHFCTSNPVKDKYERPPPAVRQVEDGLSCWRSDQHVPFRVSQQCQRWRCAVCMGSTSLELSGKCVHDVVTLGHRMWHLAQYVYCSRCGCLSDKRCGKLWSQCPKHPTTPHLLRSHKRLVAGLDPYDGEQIGQAMPILPMHSVSDRDFLVAAPPDSDEERELHTIVQGYGPSSTRTAFHAVSPTLLQNLQDLIRLHDSGERVAWPPGYTAELARQCIERDSIYDMDI